MKSIVLAVAVSFLTLLTSVVYAQGPAYLPGEVLVMLVPDGSPERIAADLAVLDGKTTGLQVASMVSAPMRTWLFRFDPSAIAQQVMLRAVRAHRAVQLAQNNHVVEQRAVPNDAQYGQQWHHQNINSEAAWDISTGGITATGDTIVVCIIENSDLPHADLIGNAWFNHQEIPNNGIDDDLNGYVDDHRGWNPAGNNDNVYGGGHGTQVAGMIGASGNNALGVAGANWNVKMMVVDYASTAEASVVASYTYPWVMRKSYNTSNGTQGAFVVATNASWGINGGQPEDSPLWCAMYDSLGTVGILSCGATANNNVNVDVVGDLPTACASDFMISVTATDVDDDRTFSAYGLTTIDVGAPGDNVFTTSMGGGYGSTSGTSFASPLTAGVIGLLYSAPCATMMALVHSDPAAGALYVREALFDGVDQVGNLGGQTVTGGRINAGTSLLAIMNNCGTCPGAYNLAATNTDLGTTQLSWNSPTATTFDLRYRAVGATEWVEVTDLEASSYELVGLPLCASYEYQVRPICDEEQTEYGAAFTWTSEGCCNVPTNFTLGPVGENVASLSWNTVLVAGAYSVRYRSVGAPEWVALPDVSGTAAQLTGLNACTNYEVQLSSICGSSNGDWSASQVFTTSGCGACEDNVYCDSEADDSGDEWIERVVLGTLDHASGNDGGYGDHTGQSTPLTIGGTYPISLTPGFSLFAFSETWRVWMDLDQDGLFAANEQVFASSAASNTTVNGTLTVPLGAQAGITRMRVVMKYNQPATSACNSFDYGETEDYCVDLQLGNVGINERSETYSVHAYPSPADRDLFINLDGITSGEQAWVTIMDGSGRVIQRKRMDQGRATITTADLAAGLYLYQLSTAAGEVARGRFMVAHLW